MARSGKEWLALAQEYYQERAIKVFDRTGPDYPARFEEYMARFKTPVKTTEECQRKYDELADGYLQYGFNPVFEANFTHISAFIACEIERLRPKRVLDSGCGIGMDLLFWARHFPQIDFIGCDVSPQMIRVAGEHAWSTQTTNVRFFEMSHKDLDAEAIGGSVEFCSLNGSLFFPDLYELAEHLYGISKILADGGTLAVCASHESYLASVQQTAWMAGFSHARDLYVRILDDEGCQFAVGIFNKTKTPDRKTFDIRLAFARQREY